MRSETVTCALFFAENLCFGPNFIRPEGTHPKNVFPETENEIRLVVFYLAFAQWIGLDPKHKTAVAKQYDIEFLKTLEENTRKKIVFAENYLQKEIVQTFSRGSNT
ncbi:MAG: hypothetical protein Q8L78_02730 [Coxiellaceae bacterium]|nr:hypothetical protein [Coxiellaceae bacterium]